MLRDYQTKLVYDIRGQISQGNKRILTVSPTGSGKTEVFSYITLGATARGNKPLILVHRRRLVEQIKTRLQKYGADADVFTVQSKPEVTDRKLIIIDEAHRSAAAGYQDIIWANPDATTLGFTATAERTDGGGLGQVYQSMVLGPSYKQLMDAGWLARPQYFAPSMPDLTKVRKLAGDYHLGDLDAAIAKSSITGDALQHYKRLAMGKKALGFCVSVNAANEAARLFIAGGIHAEAVDGRMRQRDIDAVFSRLEAGETKVVFSCDLISEGYDCPSVECIIGLRPTQSLIVNDQQIGRGARKKPDGNEFIVLDHAGNTLKHGMITGERNWSLEGRKKRKREGGTVEKVKQCTMCFYCHDPAPKCPNCGFVYPVVVNKLQQVDGELQEMLEDIKRKARKSEERGYKTLEDWLKIAQERGYNKGWAYHRHRARTGKWN